MIATVIVPVIPDYFGGCLMTREQAAKYIEMLKNAPYDHTEESWYK